MKKRVFEFRYDVSSGEMISGFQQNNNGCWDQIVDCNELKRLFKTVTSEGICLGGAQEEKFIYERWTW